MEKKFFENLEMNFTFFGTILVLSSRLILLWCAQIVGNPFKSMRLIDASRGELSKNLYIVISINNRTRVINKKFENIPFSAKHKIYKN